MKALRACRLPPAAISDSKGAPGDRSSEGSEAIQASKGFLLECDLMAMSPRCLESSAPVPPRRALLLLPRRCLHENSTPAFAWLPA